MSDMKHTAEGKTLMLERTFHAPRQRVWDAFTQPDLFIQWWGPHGWVTEVKEFNFVEGGVNHYSMKCEDPSQVEWYGKYSWGKMVFANIRPIDSFDYEDVFSDENGVTNTELPGSKTHLEFIDENGATKIVSVTEFKDEQALQTVLEMGMMAGVTETWDRLAEMVTNN